MMSGWIAADALDQHYRGTDAAISARLHAKSSGSCIMKHPSYWRGVEPIRKSNASDRPSHGVGPAVAAIAFLLFLLPALVYWAAFPRASPGEPRPFSHHERPLIIFANHASWWDPLACIAISRYFLPAASHYGAMDAVALEALWISSPAGALSGRRGNPAGRSSIPACRAPDPSTPNSVLWVTPEGRFTDTRTRPAIFRSGLAALVARLGACTLVPLAWNTPFGMSACRRSSSPAASRSR